MPSLPASHCGAMGRRTRLKLAPVPIGGLWFRVRLPLLAGSGQYGEEKPHTANLPVVKNYLKEVESLV